MIPLFIARAKGNIHLSFFQDIPVYASSPLGLNINNTTFTLKSFLVWKTNFLFFLVRILLVLLIVDGHHFWLFRMWNKAADPYISREGSILFS